MNMVYLRNIGRKRLCIGLIVTGVLLIAGAVLLMMGDGDLRDVFAAPRDPWEVRSQLLMEATAETGVCNPDGAARVWAYGLIMRSAALQYTVMTADLQHDYADRLEQTFPNWVTGVSSPWIDNVKINDVQILEDGGFIFHLCFSTASSTGPAGEYTAMLHVVREGEFWRICAIDADRGLDAYTGW